MSRAVVTFLFILICAATAQAQKTKTIAGDAWVGEVASFDAASREITITSSAGGKTESFVGVLPEKCPAKLIDGGYKMISPSELPVGTRVLVSFKTKRREVGGVKTPFNLVSHVWFLGKDEFARLRLRLRLDPSAAVNRAEDDALPEKNPLKVFFLSEIPKSEKDIRDWVADWNDLEAKKHGSIEAVSDMTKADVLLVVYEGVHGPGADAVSDSKPLMFEGNYRRLSASAFLIVPKGDALNVLWTRVFLFDPEHPLDAMEYVYQRVEERMKARSAAKQK